MRGQGEDHAVARSGRSTVRARVDRERRILRAAMVASALLHVLAIGILGGLLHAPRSEPSSRPVPYLVHPPSGMRAVNVAPVAAGEAPVPREPRAPLVEEEEGGVPTAEQTAPAPTPGPRVADDRSAADRLAPRLIDARLWRPMVLIPREPTLADVQARIAAATELLSDSALADAEARIRATDWTVKDGDGGRWGISPGKLHLGKLTLPLPVYVEEYDPRRGEYWELEAQVDRTRFLESFEDRVRKIRERRERERQERQEEGGGTVAGSGGGTP